MFNYENEILLNKARQEEMIRQVEAEKAKEEATIWRKLRSQLPAARIKETNEKGEKRS